MKSPLSIGQRFPIGRHWRRLARRSARGPVFLTTGSAATHVLLGVEAYRRLIHEDAKPPKDVVDVVAATASGASDRPLSGFRVLCRFDAYADYVAHVEADSAEEAAELANDNHEKYNWEPMGTTEFDANLYVTLDEHDNEIEATEIRNY